jgi:hypothetical protein
MGYFRRLPLSLKLIGLIGLLLWLAAIAGLIQFFVLRFHYFSALGFPNLDDVYLWFILMADVLVLGNTCIVVVARYARDRRRNLPISPALSAGQILRAVGLLAILPIVVLALELFSPNTAPFSYFIYGLGILAPALMFGWVLYFGTRPRPDVRVAGAPATPGSTAPPTPTDSGGGAMDLPTRNPTPFKSAWWSFDLGKYRPCDGTYCYYPYESIPPIRELNGTLDWLGPLDPQTDREMEIHRNAPEARGALAEIEAEAAKLSLTLPESFVRLMGSPELQDRIPSCTACTFGLPRRILPCIGSDRGYIIRFLNDQQDVLIWYLFLTPGGEQRVIVTPYEFDEGEDENPNDLPEDQRSAVIANTAVCAPSFEAFVYRWWLENAIWFKLNSSDGESKLTDEERRYLAHYAPTPN